MTLGIIGTAGRGSDGDSLDRGSLQLMFGVAQSFAKLLKADRVVSGGAAWADSVAVSLYLRDIVPNLTLHLPAQFDNVKELFVDTQAGRTANRYHIRATSVHGLPGLTEIATAIQRGAQVTTETGVGYETFFIRNSKVANDADALLAFTFAAGAALKDGGTKDTWDKFLKRREEVMKRSAAAFTESSPRILPAYHFDLLNLRLYES